jgi:hypothetical protein
MQCEFSLLLPLHAHGFNSMGVCFFSHHSENKAMPLYIAYKTWLYTQGQHTVC